MQSTGLVLIGCYRGAVLDRKTLGESDRGYSHRFVGGYGRGETPSGAVTGITEVVVKPSLALGSVRLCKSVP